MNVERTAGVVLRVRPLTETSLIIHWLTRDFGRLATVAKGARRPKSTFRGQIDLFYLADLAFSRSRRSDLHTLREARLLESHATLRTDLSRLRQASYCSALIEQTTELDAPMPSLFGQLTGFLAKLPTQPQGPKAIFAFEMKLLQELGREAMPEEIADEMQIPVERIRGILKMAQQPVSLQSPVGDGDEASFGDFIEDKGADNPLDITSFSLLKDRIGDVLGSLNDRERQVLELRFGIGDGNARTLEEVGAQFHVTRERIRQIEAKALRKMRHPTRLKLLNGFLEVEKTAFD